MCKLDLISYRRRKEFIMAATKANSVINPPNLITSARFVLSLIIFALLPMGEYFTSLILFVVAAGTDWVDGYLARKNNQVTQLGRILDPFCDKIIICGMFILIAVEMAELQALEQIETGSYYILHGWMAVIVVGREILVTALRGFIEQHGGDFSANMPGKLKMVFQCGAVVGTLIIIDSATKGGEISFTLEFATAVFVWLAILSTIYSGAIYVKGSIDLIPQLTKESVSNDD